MVLFCLSNYLRICGVLSRRHTSLFSQLESFFPKLTGQAEENSNQCRLSNFKEIEVDILFISNSIFEKFPGLGTRFPCGLFDKLDFSDENILLSSSFFFQISVVKIINWFFILTKHLEEPIEVVDCILHKYYAHMHKSNRWHNCTNIRLNLDSITLDEKEKI
jgi:hypothetical protein